MSQDAELVERCLQGDRAAWDDLVLEYSRYVYAIASQGYRLQGARRRGRVPGGIPARLRPARHAAQPRSAAPLDRPADPARLPGQALSRPARGAERGRAGGNRQHASTSSTRRSPSARRSPSSPRSARRCSTGSSAATRATGRSARSSGSPRGRSRAASPGASGSCASASVMPELPSGTVTFLFTDIEGSTRLLEELGEGYGEALTAHRAALRDAFAAHGGVEVDNQGDAFFFAFPDAREAVDRCGRRPGRARCRAGARADGPAHRHAVADGRGLLRPRREHRRARRGERARRAGRVHEGDARPPRRRGGRATSASTASRTSTSRSGSTSSARSRFPPLKTISNTNLPHPASSFVGREREVAEVEARRSRRRGSSR